MPETGREAHVGDEDSTGQGRIPSHPSLGSLGNGTQDLLLHGPGIHTLLLEQDSKVPKVLPWRHWGIGNLDGWVREMKDQALVLVDLDTRGVRVQAEGLSETSSIPLIPNGYQDIICVCYDSCGGTVGLDTLETSS